LNGAIVAFVSQICILSVLLLLMALLRLECLHWCDIYSYSAETSHFVSVVLVLKLESERHPSTAL